MCRSFGIPARLEPGTRVPQFYLNDTWHDVFFEKHPQESNLRGNLTLVSDPGNDRKPEYYTHFTIEKFDNGFYRSLDYENDPQVGNFPCTLSIAPGNYLILTGNRIQGGTVLASLQFFNLEAGKTVTQSIALRKNQLPLPVYGKISPSLVGGPIPNGMVLVWADPDKEPTKHLFADLRQRKQEFESWQGRIALVFPTEELMKAFQKKEASSIPKNIVYSFVATFPVKLGDNHVTISSLKNLPVVMFLNPQGVINYLSEGYKIGTGDELLRLMR